MLVFYNDKQTASKNTSFSPSAGKPAHVVASWLEIGLPIKIVSDFPFCTPEQITLAHDPQYVKGVLNLTRSNGFGNVLPEVRDTLPWTTGSMLAAARYAVKTGENAASPTSGFHHAGYHGGGAYCTFNGLMIAAIQLILDGHKKIGILDCDMHYGDGTEDIIEKLNLSKKIRHWTFGGHRSESFLNDLENIVCMFKDYDVILYQAGADPHINDPLGGVLTSEQMKLRDKIVFETAKKIKVPVAWNLAGGYQDPLRKVLDIHDATAIECIRAKETRHGRTKK